MPEPVTPESQLPTDASRNFPSAVVGIGGSAGALDGYERFFLNFPVGSGAALVVVPHLDPQHKGVMPELLQRCTTLPVHEIHDGMPLEADHVYVVPPGRSVGLLDGVLLLSNLDDAGGMPIDAFFTSLATDQADRAVSVVLSGAGTDGTHGVKAVKENFGQVYVQDLTRPSTRPCRKVPPRPAPWTRSFPRRTLRGSCTPPSPASRTRARRTGTKAAWTSRCRRSCC